MATVKNDNWIRRFEVTDPKKHKNGFTVYKVTSVVFPKSAPEASTSVVVWKRYNDFKKLYKSLQYYHKQCKISEELPQLHKEKYFKRFEDNVIKDRINFALELLNYIGRHQILFTSDPFLQFFNNGYNISEVNTAREDAPEICLNGNSLTGDCTQDSDIRRYPERIQVTQKDADILGKNNKLSASKKTIQNADACRSGSKPEQSVFVLPQYQQKNGSPKRPWDSKSSSDSVSMNNDCSDEDSFITSDTPESLSPIHSVDLSKLSINNLEAALDIVESPALLLEDGLMEVEVPTKLENCNNPTDFGETVTCHSEKPMEICLSVRTEDFRTSGDGLLTGDLTEEWITPPGIPAGRQDYLVEAAYHVGQAQKYEVDGDFEAAFCFYKAAIACLLSGVQDDDDKFRRQAVREKTNQYLQRAEKIYALHLAPEKESGPKKVVEAMEELKMYKVLGVIDTVMLVLNTADDGCYVIKVLQKSPCPVYTKKKTIIPFNVPYMVKLIKYFENEDSIFLVLEYSNRGKLWDSLEEFSTSKYIPENEFYSCSSSTSQYEFIDLSKTEAKVSNQNELEYKETVPSIELHLAVDPLALNESGDENESNHVKSAAGEVRKLDLDSLEVENLVENSQKLLNSVSRTLRNSEELTSNLNKELNDIETVFDMKCRLLASERIGFRSQHKSLKKRSRSAALRPKFERSYSSEDISDSRPRTASSSVDRRSEWSQSSSPRIPESTIRRWASELLVALETLHRWGIICRDLHPGNILLGEEGHILLTFQAHWKGVDSLISESSTSGFYAAPENMSVFPITPAADWWSFGALLHYLFTGKALSSCYPEGIQGHTILTFPDTLSPEACSLLRELLRYEPGERLGSGVNGAEEIKCHPFFNYVDWQVVYNNF